MENRFLDKYKNIVVMNIKSKNINRVLNTIYKSNIEVFNIKYIDYKEINMTIYEKDLDKLNSLKILNKMKVIDYKGKLKLINVFNLNKLLIGCIIFGLLLLVFLTNIVFDIEVLHTNSELKKLILEELNRHGVKKMTIKKKFSELEKIKNIILEENKERIEWLEIEQKGTKFIIKVEERKLNKNISDNTYQDIISNKDAIIKRMEAKSGVIIREVNDYVVKGDTIISGSIYLNENLKGLVKAEGTIYGEVWYNVDIEFPIIKNITHRTGKVKKVYSINFLSKSLKLDFKPYKNYEEEKKNILSNNMLPFSITKDIIEEIEKIDYIYTYGEALINAVKYADDKIKEKLKFNEYIISSTVLKSRIDDNMIYLTIFYRVYEDITATKKIEEIIEE